jgi:hypothetical protein
VEGRSEGGRRDSSSDTQVGWDRNEGEIGFAYDACKGKKKETAG